MEFDSNTPISDEQRKLAEAKRITLQPLHSDISPEPRPDSEIAAHHLVEPAAPNVSNDTEQTAAPIEPSSSLSQPNVTRATPNQAAKIVAIAAVFGVLIIATILIIMK